MNNNFKKFPSIDQFRGVIKQIRDYSKKHGKPVPTLKFTGTVKLHGTNAAVGYCADTDSIWVQSRERVITPFDDNAGFARYVEDNKDAFIAFLRRYVDDTGRVIVYGEWAGGSIQSGVALNQLPKQFYVFDMVRVSQAHREDDESHVAERVEIEHFGDFIDIPGAISITKFPSYEMDIDFAHPELSQNALVDLTLAVEAECPVGRTQGVTGIGEGIVWFNAETGLRFKVKGEKHSTSKVKTVKQIAAVDLERMATVDAFVDNVVTENRLNQGIAKLGEMGLPIEMSSIGAYIKWVSGDVLKEEMDLIIASCIDKKELMGKMAMKSKTFYIAHMNQTAFA